MFQLFIQFKTSSSSNHLFILFHYCVECATHTQTADAVRFSFFFFFLLSFCVCIKFYFQRKLNSVVANCVWCALTIHTIHNSLVGCLVANDEISEAIFVICCTDENHLSGNKKKKHAIVCRCALRARKSSRGRMNFATMPMKHRKTTQSSITQFGTTLAPQKMARMSFIAEQHRH